jgi:RNA polymerase sigma-70 factor (ECF subfamily)
MLETLYRAYRGAMVHRAQSVLGDHGLAEDAVHEAFLRIARHIPRFQNMPEDERRYLCLTIVKNAALNLLRDRGTDVPLPEDLPIMVADAALGIDLADAIGALEEGHRQVVVLRLRCGFNTAETARLLGIRPGTVRSRLNRARKLLQDMLRDPKPVETREELKQQ